MSDVTFTVWSRRHRRTTEAEETRHDTYADFATAKEFANEWVEYHKHYSARVINSKGVEVYDTRKAGITPRPKRKA